MNRNFHSITTKYNGYFNARESYREGLKSLREQHEDNYENVLSIFQYGGETAAASVSSNMDIAYQKASIAIRKHSMNIRGVEYNRYIDDAYYLIGRSHYFKKDYNLAILTFEYVIRQFDSPLVPKSKVWVAKSHLQTGNFNAAQQALERFERYSQENELSRDAQLLYHQIYADYHLKQENFKEAANQLELATQFTRSRKTKARLTFIQAQAWHRAEDYARAQQTYARVLGMNPDFQMAFQARINMAMAFDTQTGDPRFIESELEEMLKKSQNRDFQDQIYYALGQFSIRRDRTDDALDYFKQSIEHNRGNNSQKGLSFLRISEIYFDKQDYSNAAVNYDSTMVYLSREYEFHAEVVSRAAIMQRFKALYQVIEREDSLQRIANMNPRERDVMLDKIIAKIQEEELLEREREQERALMRQQMARQGAQRRDVGGESEGGWYFYNAAAMNFGRNEFYAKWGERENEDLWRISNKQIIAFGDMGDDFDLEQGEGKDGEGRITRASLMENLPTTPEKMEESNNRLSKAYYQKGLLFKDQLNDVSNATRTLETYITRFSGAENELHAAYFLYTMYRDTQNMPKANQYRDFIISNYPETDFAHILKDPNYAENIRNRQNRANELYQSAFNAYKAGMNEQVLGYYKQLDTLEVSREMEAQFRFLKALAVRAISGDESFMDLLRELTESYEGTKVHEPAVNLLAYLGKSSMPLEDALADSQRGSNERRGGSERKTEAPSVIDESVFSYNPAAVHFYVLVVNSRNIQVRQLRNAINNYNRAHHEEANLNLSTLFFDQQHQLVTITNFPDAQQALDFGKELLGSEELSGFDTEHFTALAISVDNYPSFYQDRKLKEYTEFFENAYSNL